MYAWSLPDVSWPLRMLSAYTVQHIRMLSHKHEVVEARHVLCSCDSPVAVEQESKSFVGCLCLIIFCH